MVLHHTGTWHGFLLRQQGATALFHQRHLPSIYIQGYDGDDIWLALTEDEVKQFESEKELPLSSFDNAQYRERKSVVEKQYPQFSTAIPTYSSTGPAQNQVGMSWDKVIGEEVKSADDKDLASRFFCQ